MSQQPSNGGQSESSHEGDPAVDHATHAHASHTISTAGSSTSGSGSGSGSGSSGPHENTESIAASLEGGSYTEVLERAHKVDFSAIQQYNIINHAGVDRLSRPVVVFSACNLPGPKQIDMNLLLQYMIVALDKVVESDYVVVYLHAGLRSDSRPGIGWVREVYKIFDRKYKKNLKALYIVHPSVWIRVIMGLVRPFISSKFAQKLMYITSLEQLAQYLHVDQLEVPKFVSDYDAKVNKSSHPAMNHIPSSSAALSFEKLVQSPHQQFDVDISKLVTEEHPIPLVLQQCADYIRKHGLDVEGIFRRSASAQTVKVVKTKYNHGEPVDFEEYGDVHIPAVLFKTFLRELPEPIVTFDMFDTVMQTQDLPQSERAAAVRQAFRTRLPPVNLKVLTFVFQFLKEVLAHSDRNLMTASNLAIVFAPNIVWSRTQAASLLSMGKINSFVQMLISHYDEIFADEAASTDAVAPSQSPESDQAAQQGSVGGLHS